MMRNTYDVIAKFIGHLIHLLFVKMLESRRAFNVNNPRCNLGVRESSVFTLRTLKGLNVKKALFCKKSLFFIFNPFNYIVQFIFFFDKSIFKVFKALKTVSYVLIFLLPTLTFAHEIRPAYLEIKQTTPTKYQVLWKIPLLENKAPKIDPILPDGFLMEQMEDEFLPDAYIRRYKGTYQEILNGKNIRIKGLQTTLVDVLVQINLLDESSYTLLLQPDKPEILIPVEPNKWQVIKLYVLLGIEHILIGIDHLLFVLGLLLLVKGIKPLIQTITAFTVAHSITLGAATFDLFKVPQTPVEAVIALSIVFLAREYIGLKEGKESLTAKYPWIVAFTFGLLHGFGFAGALSEIGFPQKEVPLALFTFNVGVELGQLIFIGGVLVIMKIYQHFDLKLPNWAWKIIPYAMGTIASFWLVERVVAFW